MNNCDFTIDYLYTQEMDKIKKYESSKSQNINNNISELTNQIIELFDEYDLEYNEDTFFEDIEGIDDIDDKVFLTEKMNNIINLKKS